MKREAYPILFFFSKEGFFFFVARRLVSSTLICVYVCHDLNYMNLPFLFVSVNSSLSSKRKTTNQPTKRKETCEDDGDNSERHPCLRAVPRQMARRALEKESRRKKTFCILPACYERRCAAFPCQLLGFLLSFRFLPSFFFFAASSGPTGRVSEMAPGGGAGRTVAPRDPQRTTKTKVGPRGGAREQKNGRKQYESGFQRRWEDVWHALWVVMDICAKDPSK